MTTEELKTLLYNIFNIEFKYFANDSVNRFESIDSKTVLYQHTIDNASPEYEGYNEYFNVHFDIDNYNLIKQKLSNSKYGYISLFYANNCFEFVLYNSFKNLDI